MKLFKVKSYQDTQEIVNTAFSNIKYQTEFVKVYDSLNRRLANDIYSKCDVPHFNRSVVDGYAVRLKDVNGASDSNPIFLKQIGEAHMGKETKGSIEKGETMYVPTGGMIPANTDAMVMIEYSEELSDDEICLYKDAHMYENTMLIGDDIANGDLLLLKNSKLKPQDIGVLTSIGVDEVEVFKIPTFTVISTGDEIIPPDEQNVVGKVRDINTYVLCAQIENYGWEVKKRIVVTDSYDLIKEEVELGIKNSDITILSGGSSVGKKDYTHQIIDEIEGSEVLVNGVSIKPGKPTIVGLANEKVIIGLPGQPSSAFIVFQQLLEMFDKSLHTNNNIKPSLKGVLQENLNSAPGRTMFQPVTIEEKNGVVEVMPLRGKSGMIKPMSIAQGYIIISENLEGIDKNTSVDVYLFK